ncbi:MAG TPA: NAD-dependent epimerase/dehydratase family protein, partial [Chthoniobacterales bacterium]|nr:NAD-dependent epimerase/dehydratase family protein [Chthoniobacterales bacterium]
MDKSEIIFVAGHRGMLGSAIARRLETDGYRNLLARGRSQLDLADEKAVADFFAKEKPQVVILAAARVGGIKANDDFPVEFLL